MENLGQNIAIYFYRSGFSAFVFDQTTRINLVLIVDNSGRTKDLVKFTMLESPQNERIVENVEFLLDPAGRQTWGKCMEEGVNWLYNDWDNDPIGTASCWATGFLCVIGAGIGCAF